MTQAPTRHRRRRFATGTPDAAVRCPALGGKRSWRRRAVSASIVIVTTASLLIGGLDTAADAAAPVGPANVPGTLLWTVDTANPINAANLATVRAAAGGASPQAWLRYFSDCFGGCTKLTATEIAFARANNITLGLISADPLTGDQGSSAAITDANRAVADARGLGVPGGTVLIKDIETSTPVDSDFISAWYSVVHSAGYSPGYYANTVTGSFTQQFCIASAINPSVSGSIIHTPITSLTSVGVGPGSMPAWTRSRWPDCGGVRAIYQYNLASAHPLFDQDMIDASIGGLWAPDGSVTSSFRLGAPSDIGLPAAGGWRLDSDGGLVAFGSAPARSVTGVPRGTARAVAVSPINTYGGWVMDSTGKTYGFGGSAAITPTMFGGQAVARDLAVLKNGTDAYVLDQYGGINAIGAAPQVDPRPTYRGGGDYARRLLLRNDQHSGYVAYVDGVISAFGGAPAEASISLPSGRQVVGAILADDQNSISLVLDDGSIVGPGGATRRAASSASTAAAYRPDGSGYVLTSSGTVAEVLGAPPLATSSTSATVALALVGEASGYTVDLFGGVHAFGGAAVPVITAYWPNWDIVRGIAASPDGGGFVLDGYGGLHPFGTTATAAPTLTNQTAYWPGWDAARAVVLIPGSDTQGYVLDLFGGLHPFGGAPVAQTTAYWSGWDIARSVTMLPSGLGGYVMDGFGGVHPFAVGANPLPPMITTPLPYWQGWNIARGIAANGGNSLILVDGFGGLGSTGGPLTPSFYWQKDRIIGISCSRKGWCIDAESSGNLHTSPGTPTPQTTALWNGAVLRGVSLIP